MVKTNVTESVRKKPSGLTVRTIRITKEELDKPEFWDNLSENFLENKEKVVLRLKAVHEATTDAETKRALELAWRELRVAGTKQDIVRWWDKHIHIFAPAGILGAVVLMKAIRPETPLNAAGGLGALAFSIITGQLEKISTDPELKKKADEIYKKREQIMHKFLDVSKKKDLNQKDRQLLNRLSYESRKLGQEGKALTYLYADPKDLPEEVRGRGISYGPRTAKVVEWLGKDDKAYKGKFVRKVKDVLHKLHLGEDSRKHIKVVKQPFV